MEYFDFETGFMRELKNNTYVSIYCRIIDIIEGAGFKHTHLIDSIELLKRHDITIDVHKPQQKHHLTPKIQKLHLERRKRLANFRDFIDRMPSMKGFVTEENARLLQGFLKPLRRWIGTRNVIDEKLAVYDIESRVECYYYIQLALKEANLLPFVKELIDLNKEILELERDRDDDNLSSSLGLERKLRSYRDLKMVLEVLNSVIEIGKEDCELAYLVGDTINRELRRERGYVRMVDTKKEQKKVRENNSSGTSEDGGSDGINSPDKPEAVQ